MTLPVPERIAAVIETRLANITVANGYDFDVVSVDRPTKLSNDWRPQHLGALVLQGSEEENDAQHRPGNPPARGYDVEFRIHAFVLPSDRDTTTYETVVNQFIASVKKAIVGGDNNWGQFGGLSLFADWGRALPYRSEEGDNQGAVIPMTVTFRVSELDPFEVRA